MTMTLRQHIMELANSNFEPFGVRAVGMQALQEASKLITQLQNTAAAITRMHDNDTLHGQLSIDLVMWTSEDIKLEDIKLIESKKLTQPLNTPLTATDKTKNYDADLNYLAPEQYTQARIEGEDLLAETSVDAYGFGCIIEEALQTFTCELPTTCANQLVNLQKSLKQENAYHRSTIQDATMTLDWLLEYCSLTVKQMIEEDKKEGGEKTTIATRRLSASSPEPYLSRTPRRSLSDSPSPFDLTPRSSADTPIVAPYSPRFLSGSNKALQTASRPKASRPPASEPIAIEKRRN